MVLEEVTMLSWTEEPFNHNHTLHSCTSEIVNVHVLHVKSYMYIYMQYHVVKIWQYIPGARNNTGHCCKLIYMYNIYI